MRRRLILSHISAYGPASLVFNDTSLLIIYDDKPSSVASIFFAHASDYKEVEIEATRRCWIKVSDGYGDSVLAVCILRRFEECNVGECSRIVERESSCVEFDSRSVVNLIGGLGISVYNGLLEGSIDEDSSPFGVLVRVTC